MTATAASGSCRRLPSWAEESVSVGSGLLFTAAIFLSLAHFERSEAVAPVSDLADVKLVAVPFEAPPPKPETHEETFETVAIPLAGIEAGASESPVRIAVVPPDLANLLPATEAPRTTQIDPGKLFTDFKPKVTYEVDPQHIYQRSEVDRPPTVLSRGLPNVPKWVRDNADLLRITLLIVISAHGEVQSVRLYRSSGNAEFDRIIIESVKDTWLFTPAVKSGRNVRCLAQQIVTVKWTGGSPFAM